MKAFASIVMAFSLFSGLVGVNHNCSTSQSCHTIKKANHGIKQHCHDAIVAKQDAFAAGCDCTSSITKGNAISNDIDADFKKATQTSFYHTGLEFSTKTIALGLSKQLPTTSTLSLFLQKQSILI